MVAADSVGFNGLESLPDMGIAIDLRTIATQATLAQLRGSDIRQREEQGAVYYEQQEEESNERQRSGRERVIQTRTDLQTKTAQPRAVPLPSMTNSFAKSVSTQNPAPFIPITASGHQPDEPESPVQVGLVRGSRTLHLPTTLTIPF